MEIFELIKSFPSEEKYGLSSQIRNFFKVKFAPNIKEKG